MNKDLTAVLPAFFKKYGLTQRPLLLALSGGPDSITLLHLLIHYKKTQNRAMEIHVAHVDHGWRKESRDEALQLQQLITQIGWPWHCKTLDPKTLEGNLENACRVERQRFFRELCHIYDFQAVLLAHHRNDQAETVLKRLLEGSWLPFLGGLRPVTVMNDLILWRPLLDVPKNAITQWLQDHHLTAIEDPTNRDVRFMRGRFRETIIPMITEHFGKEISGSLARLGNEAQELQAYLDEQIADDMAKISMGPMGLWLDLSNSMPKPFELRHLIRRFLEKAGADPFYEAIQTACVLLQKQAADRQVSFGSRQLFIDRKHLFMPHGSFESLPIPLQPLSEGTYGPWKITLSSIEETQQLASTTWKEALQGHCCIDVPTGEYLIGPADVSVMRKRWQMLKVPAFIRPWIPTLWIQGRCCHDFLSGATHPKANTRITLTYQKCGNE